MENVLEVYSRSYDHNKPVVCMDEMNKQCIIEVRPTIPIKQGTPERFDSEYERNGSVNIFLAVEPLKGFRITQVTATRKRTDWAVFIKELVDIHYPGADKVVLILDNLNTHSAGSLYETFEPEEARRILNRLEIHHTPKHGSWLNIAEIELSCLSKQCLNRRIPDKETYEKEVSRWNNDRNYLHTGVDWQFTNDKARIKLKRLYPVQVNKAKNSQ